MFGLCPAALRRLGTGHDKLDRAELAQGMIDDDGRPLHLRLDIIQHPSVFLSSTSKQPSAPSQSALGANALRHH